MAGKINRLLYKGVNSDWDDFIPNTSVIYPDMMQFVFITDPSILGFPHIRLTIHTKCCSQSEIRIDECSDEVFSPVVVGLQCEFGIKRGRNTARFWQYSTPYNIALIDSRFDYIESPLRFTTTECGTLDTRSEFVDFWGMISRWFNLSYDGTSGDLESNLIMNPDSLLEPPRVCFRELSSDNSLAPWLTPL